MTRQPDNHPATGRPRRGCLGALLGAAAVVARSPWPWLVLLALVVAAFVVHRCEEDPPTLTVEHTKAIDTTPEEIRRIREIREWEFLSVSTEELVEAYEAGTFGDKQLARIYTGTLRLGIDMSRADDRWFEARGDTAVLRPPDQGPLDDNFVDETRTRAFYEKGSWPAAELDRLYERARTAMLRRHLTKAHLDEARQSAREQFTRIFQGLGFTTVDVSFVPPSNKTKQA